MAVGTTLPSGTDPATPIPAQLTLKIESLLHAAVREAFAVIEKNHDADVWSAVEAAMTARGATTAGSAGLPMPADLWARLVATVQIEAARSANTRAINPDSVLLSPDPLLAPKKSLAPDDADGFDLAPSTRFLLAALLAILIAITVTIYFLTRSTGETTAPQPGGGTVPSTTINAPASPAAR
jgi:hypothetical protein